MQSDQKGKYSYSDSGSDNESSRSDQSEGN